MTERVGVNGFGRMGRLGLRAGWNREDLSVVQVKEAAEGKLKDIFGYEERPLVSVDYPNDPRSSMHDRRW